jgi:MazG family protein
MSEHELDQTGMSGLLAIMARLRDPDNGCPWDRKQTLESIVPYTIEEAYEVADAIHRGNLEELREELGDLLFQVVFYAQIARELGAFGFDEVVTAISEKMLRRHPHVFGDTEIGSAEEQRRAWERHKAEERAQRAANGLLDGVAGSLPALIRAEKLQRRAAKVGFDWHAPEPVADKIAEELEELRGEIRAGSDAKRLEDELGDLLFSCVNLARHLNLHPEQAIAGANRKFERRFGLIEAELARRGQALEDTPPDELERLWTTSKHAEQDKS